MRVGGKLNTRLSAVLLAVLVNGSVSAQTAEDFKMDEAQLSSDIGKAQRVVDEDRGIISDIAFARLETLLLTKALLENRRVAEEGGQANYVDVPVVKVDQEMAGSILADIDRTSADIKATEGEISVSDGLTQMLAMTRLETERLTLAQLKLAYYQAAYGIALPSMSSGNSGDLVQTRPEAAPIASPVVSWADPKYPDIDYAQPMFQSAHDDGSIISGWWSISESKAAIDDSPSVLAINYSQYTARSFSDAEVLLLRCSEGVTQVVYLPGEFIMGGYDDDYLDVTIRIDENPAELQRWSELTSNKGAGVFGQKAEPLMRSLYIGSKLFVRLKERSGRHDSTFDLAGIDVAVDMISQACGWTTLLLTVNDYKAIQSILNAAGFTAGTADGVWGRGSRDAMRAFQKTVGLQESGAPTRETLIKLGYMPKK